MKILYVIPNLSFELGGAPKVVIGIAKALVEKGVEVSILTSAEKGKEEKVVRPKGAIVQICKRGFLSHFWTAYSSIAAQKMREEMENCDLVHIHELWHYLHYIGYKIARRLNKPYGVTIHDQLSPWDLRHKAFRKVIYSIFIQKKVLREASFLHAIVKEEAENIHHYGIDRDVYVIPNGIGLEEFNTSVDYQFDFQKMRDKVVVLFLGRIHPKKGLDLLTKAWIQTAKGRNDLILVIAGPDTVGYRSTIERILKSGDVLNKAIFLGMVKRADKKAVLQRADIVVIPSYSEVRTLVALEAMINQKPIIITDKCHFPEVGEAEAGIIIEPHIGQLVNALNKLLINPKMREKMGRNGRKLVLERYTWDKISEKIIEMYKCAIEKSKQGK